MLTTISFVTRQTPVRARALAVACVCLAALLLPLRAAADDLIITSKVTSQGGKTSTSSTYMTAAQMKRSDDQRDTIIDFASGKITRIDRTKKEYSEMSKADMEALSQEMTKRMSQNPQAAKMMEGMMSGMVGTVTVTKGTASKKIAGYDCQEYVVSMGEAMKMSLWTTLALTPPVQPSQMYSAMSVLGGSGPMAKSMSAVYAEMQKIKGVGLAESSTISVMGTTMTTSSEATEVKRGPIDPAVFAIPAGFKKVDGPGMAALKK